MFQTSIVDFFRTDTEPKFVFTVYGKSVSIKIDPIREITSHLNHLSANKKDGNMYMLPFPNSVEQCEATDPNKQHRMRPGLKEPTTSNVGCRCQDSPGSFNIESRHLQNLAQYRLSCYHKRIIVSSRSDL